MVSRATFLALALLPLLLSAALVAVGQSTPSDASARQQCISSGRYQLFTGDWPIAREIADQTNYLKGAFWNTVQDVSKTASVSGCVADAEHFGNLNTSDLVTFSGKFMFKGQQLSITTRVSLQTVVMDTNNGLGVAQNTVVCYVDDDDLSNVYRCNILAKPAQIAAVTAADQRNLSFPGGEVAYAGYSLINPTWGPVPGLSAGLSRRDLATDDNIKWFSDLYTVGQYNLSLPQGYTDVGSGANFTIRRAGAEYINTTCSRQVVLQPSIASEVAGGATFACVMWGPIQVYSFDEFAFEVTNNMDPCTGPLTAPYAVLTQGAPNAIEANAYMTIYNGVADANPAHSFDVINTLTCFTTSTTGEAVEQQALDVYEAFMAAFNPAQIANASFLGSDATLNTQQYFTTQFRGTNSSCGFAAGNFDPSSGFATVLAASELTAARSMSSLAGMATGPYGIVRADPQGKPCKVVPHENPPVQNGLNTVGVQDSDFGASVNNSVVFAFAYTFNSANTLQYNNMADQINALQSAYTFSSVLTTCIATIVAGAGVPIFSKVGMTDSKLVERGTFLVLIVVEIAGSISAAVLRMVDMSNFNQGGYVYQVSDTSQDIYSYAYLNQNLLVNVMATMEARISTYIIKIILLAGSSFLATVVILYRWRQKLKKPTSSSSPQLQPQNSTVKFQDPSAKYAIDGMMPANYGSHL